MNDGVTVRQRFGERARGALSELGLTYLDLAVRCALPAKRVEHILHGRLAKITLRDMALIASVLGTPLFSLMGPIEAATIVAEAFEIVE